MSNMAKVRSARSEMPGRADSLSRMLELEKQYKLRRTSQDNGSIHPTPPGPIGTRPSSSALPDSALRVRRASAHPPPTQNMKAARRSAGLPSLSISIRPSPTSTQGAEDDDPTPTDNQELGTEPQKEPGERTKTVTFSGPQEDEEDEEDNLSDAASSICHSPSWEGFGQSTKKKAKKREKKEKKKLEEKAIKASKKQANRLSKAPPQDPQSIQALNSSDRSLSAPNLEQPAKFNPRSLLSRSTTEFPTETMASQNLKAPAAPSDENVKPKNRGFLASFRSSSAGPKKAPTPRGSVDESQSIHSGTFAGPPSHLYNSTVPGADHDFTNPRQAPSIRSSTSGSTQSMSSQEKRPGLGRHSSSLQVTQPQDGPQPPPKISEMPASPPPSSKRLTFAPAAYLENGEPIRSIFLPGQLRNEFLRIASDNTRRGLEMCGILCGTAVNNALFIKCLVIPEQKCTSDTCETENESELFDYCMTEDLLMLGWIHTHPTQSCFMSSRDLHTQAGYQVMLPESIAIVCAPKFQPSYGIFRLTNPPGLPHILHCNETATFHQHSIDNLYTGAEKPAGHVFESDKLNFEIKDLRPAGTKK